IAPAVLSVVEEDKFPFITDEVMNSTPGLKPIKYTIEDYLRGE
ncbi:unnamed protein product, partial [Didymodactylos carnosus]